MTEESHPYNFQKQCPSAYSVFFRLRNRSFHAYTLYTTRYHTQFPIEPTIFSTNETIKLSTYFRTIPLLISFRSKDMTRLCPSEYVPPFVRVLFQPNCRTLSTISDPQRRPLFALVSIFRRLLHFSCYRATFARCTPMLGIRVAKR